MATRGTRHSQLLALLAPVVEALDCQLWGIELVTGGKRSTLRLYIDKTDGVDLTDCEKVSRQVGSVLDVEDPIAGEFTLEVSSPGLDRPLYTLDQFARYVGEEVDVRLRAPYEGRRKYKGLLAAVEDDEVVVRVDEHEYVFPVESIDKAKLVPRFGRDEKRG